MEAAPTQDVVSQVPPGLTRFLTHGRENLLEYLVFSAWLKFMGASQYIPAITVGG